MSSAPPKAKLPSQIPFIIGNEAAERFSFYGMRTVLTNFLVGYLLIGLAEQERQAAAKEVFHVFVMGVYFFPLLGGWLSDRFLGKYRTIFWLSLVYCVGQVLLALSVESKPGFYAGLFLIALGSGGIKPCVSAFVGDQFDQTNKHLAKVVFDAFYWIINFGSFFASLLIPPLLSAKPTVITWNEAVLFTLDTPLPRLAFGIPAILMVLATVIFWAGRKKYVNVPPTPSDPHSFSTVCLTAVMGGTPGFALAIAGGIGAIGSLVTAIWLGVVPAVCLAIVVFLVFAGGGAWLQIDRARGKHPDEDVDGVRAVLRVLVIFALVTPFWSLFDQKASTWILQGNAMELPGWSWFKSAAQMQALNPLLVMLLIPFNNVVLYPLLRKAGIEPTPLRRMGTGIAFSGLAWIAVAMLQVTMDGGQKLPVLYQSLPYALLTFGEVLVSATGLEFAYSQAPAKLKGVLMSFWSLSVTIGNLWVLVVNATVKNETVTKAIGDAGFGVMAFQMFFFAGFAFAAAAAFAWYAKRYTLVDYYRKA
ncbi:MAG: POT family MFS transporter [Archangiaceae bacterium]|nr:POT family MFS transporter [Archangiaceae bacterium]